MKNRTGLDIRIAKGVPLAVVALAAFATIAPSARAADLTAAEQCDREAGSEFDHTRNKAFPAVATQDIRIGIALSACREAYNHHGGARIQFQLARVLDKAGQKLQSQRILAEAAKNGHALAMVSYGDVLAERGEKEAAVSLYQRAAAQGNVLAARYLAATPRDEVATNVDDAVATQWLARADTDRLPR
jgi:TPR repeat protein